MISVQNCDEESFHAEAMKARNLAYVLITPAHNEEEFLERTIQSVISQTIPPKKWVIVSDGSIDHTDEIVRKYLAACPWMELVRMPEHGGRHFAAKVRCFNAGLERLAGDSFDIVGNLDADITFEKDYFEFLLGRFAADEQLGVAGTPFIEENSSYDYRFSTVEHVAGACQLFRRKCFEQIGGYRPVEGGGIDWIAVTTARMRGWKTRTFLERTCHHQRPMGTASAGKLMANFRLGTQDYYLGGHPLWQLFRGCYQMIRRPYIVGGMCLVGGYCWAWITGVRRPVFPELIRFHRHEQMRRLRQVWFRVIGVSE
jgi:glycosyltransferase involved in cell wall biosynthesis